MAPRTSVKELDPLLAGILKAEPRRGDLMKERIVRSAIRCIARHGIEGTTFEAIGKPLGVRKSHVAYHFKDKGEIIETAIHFVIGQAQQLTADRVAAAPTLKAKIMAMVEAALDWAAEDPDGAAVYMLFFYYCTTDERYRARQQQIRETGAQRLEAMIRESISGRAPADLKWKSKALHDAMTGTFIEAITVGRTGPAARRDCLKAAEAATDAVLSSI